jgi:hypothetical protein
MKKYLVISIAFLLSSCMTVRRIQRNCEEFSKICTVNTWHDIQYRDTIIYLDPIEAKLPISDINISMQLTVKDGRVVNIENVKKTQGLITTDAWIEDGVLTINSFLNDSTILIKPDPVIIHDAIVNEITGQTIKIKFIPKTYKWSFWIVIIEIFIGVLILVKKLFFK